jgi:nitrite reductase/ring-hydroxylating ferredoxin subunit
MNRKDFIKSSCLSCLSFAGLSSLLSACNITQYIKGNIVQNGITIKKDDFRIQAGKGSAFKSYIIVQNDTLLFPICVFRLSDTSYSALWMKCSHQGATLQVSGDSLQCPAHGSEFRNDGKVVEGPASSDLRSFPVTVNNDEIFIDLRRK